MCANRHTMARGSNLINWSLLVRFPLCLYDTNLVVTHIFLVDTRKIARPRLARLACRRDIAAAGTNAKWIAVDAIHFVVCAPGWNRTNNSGLEVRSYIHLTTGAVLNCVLKRFAIMLYLGCHFSLLK